MMSNIFVALSDLDDPIWAPLLNRFKELIDKRLDLARLRRDVELQQVLTASIETKIETRVDQVEEALQALMAEAVELPAKNLAGITCKAFMLLDFVSASDDLTSAGAHSLSTDILSYVSRNSLPEQVTKDLRKATSTKTH